MYKLKEPSRANLEVFFENAKESILNRIDDWLNNNVNDVKVKCRSRKLDLTAKVIPGGLTYKFLTKLNNEENLKKLMLGKMDFFIQFVTDLKKQAKLCNYPEEYLFEKLRQIPYEKFENRGIKLQDTVVADFDHFNTIVKDIFLFHGYDGEYSDKTPVFKKDDFVKLLGIRICPYCGRAFIYSVQRVGDRTMVKPQIDHFLPKSRYPFFALSFMNLIPSCQTCNMIGCKGDNDPIDYYNSPPSFKIQYPYEFDESKVLFKYVLNGSSYFLDDNFIVTLDYHGDTILENGSNAILKMEEFYKQHNIEIACMYRRMMILASRARYYYEVFGIDKKWLYPTPMMMLGYNLNEKNEGKYMLYKLNKDIYLQMMNGEIKKLFK